MNFKQLLIKHAQENDESDEDYQPEIDLEKENKKNSNKNIKNYKEILQKVENIWNEMQKEKIVKINKENNLNGLEIAQKILNSEEKSKKKVRFAGQEYLINDNGELELVIQTEIEKKKNIEEEIVVEEITEEKRHRENLKNKFKYLKKVLEKINSKTKNINLINKSKLDWKQYTKKEKLENEFEKNRKKGFLDKANFLQKATEKEIENNLSKRKKVKFEDNSITFN